MTSVKALLNCFAVTISIGAVVFACGEPDEDTPNDCAGATCSQTEDECCPGTCMPENDVDCCEAATCSQTSDNCCSTDCTLGNDIDCCDNASCSLSSDGCCPTGCTQENDIDCCDSACSQIADGCCPITCSPGDDIDCCEATSCSASADGCCPSNCEGSCDDVDCSQCTSGDCCNTSTCEFQSASTPCASNTEYRCTGTSCEGVAEQRPTTQYCSGSSSSCDGTISGDWTTTPCGADDLCDTDGATYAVCTSCTHGCGDGACWPECNPSTDTCCEPDGTMISWHDATSGLCWQEPPDVNWITWYEAAGVEHDVYNPGPEPVNYCSTLGPGWRLPTISELRSLFRAGDETACECIEWDMTWDSVPTGSCGVWDDCIVADCWRDTQSLCTWEGQVDPPQPPRCAEMGGPGAEGCYLDPALTVCTYHWALSEIPDILDYDMAWYVQFAHGGLNPGLKDYTGLTRCVR